jgi:hypothetical protein
MVAPDLTGLGTASYLRPDRAMPPCQPGGKQVACSRQYAPVCTCWQAGAISPPGQDHHRRANELKSHETNRHASSQFFTEGLLDTNSRVCLAPIPHKATTDFMILKLILNVTCPI